MNVKRWKQPKKIDKWSNRLIGGVIKQLTVRIRMKVIFETTICENTLQNRSNFHFVLAKMLVEKQVKLHYFQSFMSSVLSIFKRKTCILHHLAFLDWLPSHDFSSPNTHFQHLKPRILMAILPLSAMFFMALKGFVYAIAVYVYAFCLAFCCILPCVQQQNALHLAAFYLAFCTKTQSILHQNALRFAAKRTLFCSKQPQNRYKWRRFQINIHFANIHMLPLFAPKQTFARIDYLQQDGRLVGKKALIMLKSLLKTRQKNNCCVYIHQARLL